LANDSATATRCCSPPLSSSGRLFRFGAQADHLQQAVDALLTLRRIDVGDQHRQLQVLARRERRNEIEKTEKQSRLCEAGIFSRSRSKVPRALVADENVTAGRMVDSTKKIEQRCLAAT